MSRISNKVKEVIYTHTHEQRNVQMYSYTNKGTLPTSIQIIYITEREKETAVIKSSLFICWRTGHNHYNGAEPSGKLYCHLYTLSQ